MEIKHRRRRSFTLLELLIVIALISLLMVLVAPAFTTLKRSSDLTTSAATISGAIETARTYAKANNTYSWLGFYEEDQSATTPTSVAPPYTGKGQLVLAIVASLDGTKIFQDNDTSAPLPAARIRQVSKLIRIYNVHLTDVGAPSSPNTSDFLNGRPDWPYTYAAGLGADHYNRISSESSDTTKFNFTVQNYTFYKTVRFSPRGEANINSTYAMKKFAEIGMRPTHGNAVDNTQNVVAIQLGGIGGGVKIYRR